jgi:hypothetical protein
MNSRITPGVPEWCVTSADLLAESDRKHGYFGSVLREFFIGHRQL